MTTRLPRAVIDLTVQIRPLGARYLPPTSGLHSLHVSLFVMSGLPHAVYL